MQRLRPKPVAILRVIYLKTKPSMKYFAFITIAGTLLSGAAFGADQFAYINGQSARMIIGQATFTDQYPGTSDRLLGAAGGVAYGSDTLIIADSSRFTGLTP